MVWIGRERLAFLSGRPYLDKKSFMNNPDLPSIAPEEGNSEPAFLPAGITEAQPMQYPNIAQSWGIIGISIVFMLAFIPILVVFGKTGTQLPFLVYYVASMGATFWFANRKRSETTETTYNFDAAPLKTIALVSIAAMALQIGIVSPIINLIPMPDLMKRVFLQMSERRDLFALIAIVVAAPVLEELIFRGIILDGLLKRYSPLKSILVSSALFGFLHLNPWQFVGAFTIGIFSGWVYHKTKNLSLCVAIHLANNLLVFASAYFSDQNAMMDQSFFERYGGVMNFIMITVGAIAVAAMCLYLLRSDLEDLPEVS